MKVEGEDAYCIDINTAFKNGYKTRSDASTRMSADQISDVALSIEYVKQYAKSHTGLSSKHAYLLRQLVVWQRLSVHLGWQCDNVRASYDEIPKATQDEVFAGAKAFVKENKGRYDCGGYIYSGEGQELGQFWAKLAVGNTKLQKTSTNANITDGNGIYSIAGATYGVYSDKDCTKQLATLTTDTSGNAEAVEVRATTVYIKELSAPAGFKIDKTVYSLSVEAGKTATLKVSDTPKVTDTLIELFKIDMETQKSNPQGNASLEGAEFTWNFYAGYYNKNNLPAQPTRTWVTKTIAEKDSDGAIHYITRLADKYKVSGDSFYTQDGKNVLPLGTLTVEETKSPSGYLLAGAYMQADGSEETSEDGVWFGTSEPDDSKGALLYDTYIIEELRCESNKGFKLIPPFEIVISRNKVVVDLGTLTDAYEKEITIHTTATSKDGEKTILAGKDVTIIDTVKLDGLIKGTKYQLKGWQMLKEENAELIINNKRVENDYTFVADDEAMKVEIAYTFNASALGGKSLVTFEELYDLSNPEEPVKVAEHKDIDDDGQTVLITERIIKIHTIATDKDGKKEIEAGKDVTIVDTVKLEGLEVGTKYQLVGWQMLKDENAELIINDKRVENDYIFTADSETMEAKIEFTFDASSLGGKQLVTFEELYDLSNPDEPIKVTEHKDIEDDGQTVTIKEVPETPTPEESEKSTTPDTPTKTDSPKTGDNTNLYGLIAMLCISGAGLTGTYFFKRRKMKKSFGNVLEPIGKDYLYSELVNPVFTKDGDNMKVKVAVKFLDNQTKATQVLQYELILHKDSNWKIIM